MDVTIPIIVAIIVLLTIFLMVLSALRYAVEDGFVRTRLVMTLFFCFIVGTLTLSFWPYALVSLQFSAPAAILGALVGYFAGVKTAEEKLMIQGLEHYMEHFSHVHISDLTKLQWWSVVNFYSIAGALVMTNLVGLSTVIYRGNDAWALTACAAGAFLIGTIFPYLVHLWSIKAPQKTKRTTSEA